MQRLEQNDYVRQFHIHISLDGDMVNNNEILNYEIAYLQ